MQVYSDMAGKTKRGVRSKQKVAVHTARTKSGAIAVHAKAGEHHVVGIGDLRVMIVREDDGCWFAHGLEIDFAEQGTSLDDVQERFEKSLADTIREHLNVRGNIRSLLRLAPADIWTSFYDGVAEERFRHTCVTAHRLLPQVDPEQQDQKRVPFFDNIKYHSPATAQA
jgi:hypothetical protein